jgi:hypothetical protein
MGKPHSKALEALKMWLDGRTEGPNGRTVASFQGLSAQRLDDANDLVALHPHFERDWLNKLVELSFLRLLFLVFQKLLRIITNVLTRKIGFTCRRIDHDPLEAKNGSRCCNIEHHYCCHSIDFIDRNIICRSKFECPTGTYMWIHNRICC